MKRSADQSGPAVVEAKGVSQLLTYPEAWKALAISESTLRRLVETGDLPIVKIGRCLRFDPADLAAFIDSRRTKSHSAC